MSAGFRGDDRHGSFSEDIIPMIDTLERVTTGTTDDTACCAHFVRDGLSATFPDGCAVDWDDEGFTFTHAHPDREAEVTFEEEES